MLRTGRNAFQIPAVARYFSFLQNVQLAVGPTVPHIQWVLGLFPGGKTAGASSDPLTSI